MTLPQGSPAGTPSFLPVRVLYLVPSDMSASSVYELAIRRAALHVRAWYWDQMGERSTFRLGDPVVEVVSTPRPAAWFAQHDSGGDASGWYWQNATAAAAEAAGARLDDPLQRWAVYLDAELGPGQNGGTGGGIAVMHSYDLLGLAGRNVLEGPNEDRVCRWVGGLAHELGHAFGLPHPEPCEHEPGHPNCRSLMYFGYRDYPRTWLLSAEIAALEMSRFFGEVSRSDAPGDCQNLIQ